MGRAEQPTLNQRVGGSSPPRLATFPLGNSQRRNKAELLVSAYRWLSRLPKLNILPLIDHGHYVHDLGQGQRRRSRMRGDNEQ